MAEDDEAGPDPDPKPGGRAGAVKAWADAVSAAMKAALFAAAALLVGAVVIATASRDHGRRQIIVEVDAKADALLRDRGADIDLRDTLTADLSADIEGVEAFIRTSLFKQVSLTGSPDPISLKSLGVDVTTDEIDRLYRLIFGAPEPFKVKVGLLCPAGSCDPASAGDPKQLLTLLVDLHDGERARRLTFHVPPANPGLRRGVRMAMQSASETLMEQIDPLLAALLYLNLPESSIFADERRRYARLGAAATALVGGEAGGASPARACMAEIVFYGNVARSAGTGQGLDDAVAAGSRDGADPTCRYAANTSVAVRRMQSAVCDVDWRSRAAQIRLARDETSGMDALAERLGGLERDEIRQRQLVMRFWLAAADAADSGGSWAGLCVGGFVPWDGALASFDLAPFSAVADGIEARFPARSGRPQTHALLHVMTYAFPLIPRGALAERNAWATRVAKLAARYVPGDPAPRLLLSAWARALSELAQVRVDALSLSGPDLATLETSVGVDPSTPPSAVAADAAAHLRLARIAFEYASASASASTLAEPFFELDAIVAAGDAAAQSGEAAEARGAYALAVRTFADHDEPPREIVGLALAAAHWLAALRDAGACAPGAPRDADWDQAWSRLGARPGHPMCDALRSGAAPGDESLGLLALVRPIASASAERCRRAPPAFKTSEVDLEAVARLRCMRDYEMAAARSFEQSHSQQAVEDAIEQAIAAR